MIQALLGPAVVMPPAEGVLLDLGLGLVAVTAAVFWLSASLRILFQ